MDDNQMENEEFEETENILTLENPKVNNPTKDSNKFAQLDFPDVNEFLDFNNYIEDMDNSQVSLLVS